MAWLSHLNNYLESSSPSGFKRLRDNTNTWTWFVVSRRWQDEICTRKWSACGFRLYVSVCGEQTWEWDLHRWNKAQTAEVAIIQPNLQTLHAFSFWFFLEEGLKILNWIDQSESLGQLVIWLKVTGMLSPLLGWIQYKYRSWVNTIFPRKWKRRNCTSLINLYAPL